MTSYINNSLREFQRTQSQALITHIMMLAHFVQKYTMDELTKMKGYRQLSLSYEGYISLLAETDCSPGELARKLGITKQACNKTVRELEKLGIVEQRKNPDDSRSKILSLTERGLRLVHDGIKVTADVQQQFSDKIGAEHLSRLIDILDKLCNSLAIEVPTYRVLERIHRGAVNGRSARLSLLLPKLSNYLHHYLVASLTEKGFIGLKPNFSQVLGLISQPEGGRIQQISSVIGVTKQAIAMIALELEQLGYIVRESDPHDKRQIILRLSPQGKKLLSESTASVNSLDALINEMLSEEDCQHLQGTMATLYSLVADYYDTLNEFPPARIQELSQNLLAELGITGARTLAQQLITITGGTV